MMVTGLDPILELKVRIAELPQEERVFIGQGLLRLGLARSNSVACIIIDAQKDRPAPRRGSLEPGCEFGWLPSHNTFIIHTGCQQHLYVDKTPRGVVESLT